MSSKFYRIPMFLMALTSTSSAWAAIDVGSLTYGPVANVPTISGSMLIVLAMILAVIGYRMLKNKSGGGTMAAALVGAVALTSSVGGVKLISDADAFFAANFVDLDRKFGGTVEIFPDSNNIYTNVTDRAQIIFEIIWPGSCMQMMNPGLKIGSGDAQDPNLIIAQYCRVGQTLDVGESCELACGVD